MKNVQKKGLEAFAKQEISGEKKKIVKGGTADIVIIEIVAT